MYDIIIVGAGPAGLTAAVYARRAGKSVLVLEKDTFGGQITFSPKLENYPGFQEISGNDLAQKMLEQALNLGAEIDMDTRSVCSGSLPSARFVCRLRREPHPSQDHDPEREALR